VGLHRGSLTLSGTETIPSDAGDNEGVTGRFAANAAVGHQWLLHLQQKGTGILKSNPLKNNNNGRIKLWHGSCYGLYNQTRIINAINSDIVI
jgi:hypothetical protein